MPRRGRAGKRIGLVIALATAVTILAAGLAFGAAPIIGQADNTFNANVYTIDQGEVAQLQVTGSSHNATANQNGPDGRGLFRSATISSGTTPVNGTQYLTTGGYTFICTIHPSTMQATLQVTGNGAPQARPSAALTLRTKTISKAVKKGLLVSVNASTKIDGVGLVAMLGKATIGQVRGLSLAAGQQVDLVKLSKAGKSKLRGKSKATVTVTADIPFGSPASAKGKLK
jgi:plastocyanin